MPTIEKIEEFYKDSVKEQDKKGYAGKFKAAMKAFEKDVSEKAGVTFEEIQYLDGYFIFGKGTNSVVHFKLKETPGWKYGIWWESPKRPYYDKLLKKYIKPEYIEGVFFAQYEKTIDKFKPAASTIQCNFSIVPNKDEYNDLYEIRKNIAFIMEEPYLAFLRSYDGVDYNHTYISRKQAKKEFDLWLKDSKNQDKWRKKLDNMLIKFVKKLFNEEFKDDVMMIIDCGDNWSPRYEIIMRESYWKDTPDMTPGHSYNLFDDDIADLKKKWDKKLDQLRRLEDKHNVLWFRCLDDDFIIVKDKKYDELKKEAV